MACTKWTSRRAKMLNRIQSDPAFIRKLIGPELLEELDQVDAVTLLLGGVADSGATFEPHWSKCAQDDDISFGGRPPFFLHVAYFLYKVQRRRLRTIYHGLYKTAKSQSPHMGMTAISEEQDASATARDPGESDAEA